MSHHKVGGPGSRRPPRGARLRVGLWLAAAVSVIILIPGEPSASAPGGAAGADVAAPRAIRAAFYYPWFPETERWASRYNPSMGRYHSSDLAVLSTHVAQAKYAGLDAFISSYWGRESKTGTRLPLLLEAARAQGFHVSPYYEPESYQNPPMTAQLRADFDSLAASSSDAAWLKVDGKPVLFVYNIGVEGSCRGVDRIIEAAAGRFYLNAKVFPGYQNCLRQPDSWHQYAPAFGYDQQGLHSATVSPGFYKFSEARPRLTRDITRFEADLTRQVRSGARWQLVTSFNEWGEGSSVEPAREWQSPSRMGAYLDAMRVAYT
jgi:hypothetical protein